VKFLTESHNKDTAVMAAVTKNLLNSGVKVIYESAIVYRNLIIIGRNF